MKIVNIQTVVSGAKVAAGFAAGSYIANKLKDKDTGEVSYVGIAAQLLGAGLIAGFMGKKGSEIALGVAAGGVVNALRKFAPTMASDIGLAGIGAYYSTDVNLLAGTNYNGIPNQVPNNLVVE